MNPQYFYRGIYLWFTKRPLWLRIAILVGLCALSYPAFHVWAILFVAFIACATWYFGHKDPDTNRRFTVKYITGVPQFPKPLSNMVLYVDGDGLRLKYVFKPAVKLSYDVITKIEAETRTQITRTASMFKGAAGLLLAGPLGAMVGMGIGSKHDDSQYFVTIVYKDELGEENLLILQQAGMLSSHIGNSFEIATVLKEARKIYLLGQRENKA